MAGDRNNDRNRGYYGSGVDRSGVVKRRDGSLYDTGSTGSGNRVRATYDENGFGYSRAAGSSGKGRSQGSTSSRSSQGRGGQYSRNDGRKRGEGTPRRRTSYDHDVHERYKNEHSRSGYYRGRSASNRGGSKKGIIAVAIVAVLVVGVIYYFTNLVHIDIVVNGSKVSVAKNTTYDRLRDTKIVADDPGDFVAVDGSVLEAGKGQPTKLLDNGVPVEDYGARVTEESVITQERGDNIMEDYDSTQMPIPIAFEVNDGTFNFYTGCLHAVVSNGKEGLSESKVGKVSGITVTDEVIEPMQPRLMKSVNPEIGPTDDKVIALTFDDGPFPEWTQAAIDLCAKHGVKATFFMLGSQVDEMPDMARAVANAGHQVASHTYSHESSDYLNKLDDEGVRQQLSKAQASIEQATGVKTTCVRPPGGNINYENIIAGQEYLTVLAGWTIDSEDWRKPGADVIAQTIMGYAANGSIILCHDGGGDRSQTMQALEIAIPQLQAQGYRFVTIDELVQLRAPMESAA